MNLHCIPSNILLLVLMGLMINTVVYVCHLLGGACRHAALYGRTTRGGAPAAGGESQWVGSGSGRGEVDREHRHFESGHTCLSCERP